MTDQPTDPTEILSRPDPTESVPTGAGAPAGPWVAGPPPPPGRDPAIPVRDAPPADRPPVGPPSGRWWSDPAALRAEPVWVLGAAAILVAYVVAWLDAVLVTVRHQPGLSALDRVLELFGPGSVEWGVILLVGLGLMAGARLRPGAPSPLWRAVDTGLLVAAAGVVGAAALGLVVELANFGHGIDAAFTGLIDRLGAIVVGGAALWWAWRARSGSAP